MLDKLKYIEICYNQIQTTNDFRSFRFSRYLESKINVNIKVFETRRMIPGGSEGAVRRKWRKNIAGR